MMHIKYTSREGFYTWNELCCLSRALGFQANTLNSCIPDEALQNDEGIVHKEILKLINLKYFNDALDRTFNMHTADYNINVLKKSLKILNHRLLSFSELNDVRIAFQVYEAADMKGMVMDQHTLMRTLKLCNRIVAPLKLMHRIKHLQEFFDEPDRIQFYEFLDLLVLCQLIPEVQIAHQKDGSLDKSRELYELDDFEKVCTTLDEKIEDHLNSMFMRTERDYGKEHLGDKRIPKETAVDTSDRKKRVRHHDACYKELQNHLDNSTRRLLRTKAGHVRERPVSAPSVEPIIGEFGSSVQKRPYTVDQTMSTLTSRRPDPRATLFETYLERCQSRKGVTNHSKPHAGIDQQRDHHMVVHLRKRTPDNRKIQAPNLVTEETVEERQNVLDNLQYEIETLEERTIKQLYTGLNKIYPTYKERRLLEKSKIKPKQETKKVKKKSKKIDPETLQRLSRPEPRAFLAVHDSTCDARLVVAGLKQKNRPRKNHRLTLEGQTSTGNLDRLPKTLRTDGGSISSADETSTKTFDTSRHSLFTHNLRNSHVHLRDYDREKYKSVRVGAAAVLYDYFYGDNVGTRPQTAENNGNNIKDDEGLNSTKREKSETETMSSRNYCRVPSAGRLHTPLNINQLVGDNYLSQDPCNGQHEQARNTRRLMVKDEDELKINGVLLSEIDKLTIKKDVEKITFAHKWSLPALTHVNQSQSS
ncbi:uncharacterized protein LOC117113623 isoform X2 [Anneissia japonica]|uniref:uncharacterized protein LOC117113623 isoform X2 n=1 Tax=Anneissia japonica TaxID=1529436 RepID=UPI0014259725|nr:uncharacterized protein LOC117113623 isoform X2 [Anneissia japonica]